MQDNVLDEIEHRKNPFFYEAILSDGTVIYTMDGGKAIDFNGNAYTAVFDEDEDGEIGDVKYWIRNEK